MRTYKGWRLVDEGIHYFARKGAASRKFDTRGDRAAWLKTLP